MSVPLSSLTSRPPLLSVCRQVFRWNRAGPSLLRSLSALLRSLPCSRDDADRARTWLNPERVEQFRGVSLTDAVRTHLQDRNEAITTLAYDAGLRAGELSGFDTDHVDLEAVSVYLPTAIQRESPPPAPFGLELDVAVFGTRCSTSSIQV